MEYSLQNLIRGRRAKLKKLERLGKIYDTSVEVNVKENGEDGDDGVDIGLDKHLPKETDSEDSMISNEEIDENCKPDKEIPTEIILEKDKKDQSDPDNPSTSIPN